VGVHPTRCSEFEEHPEGAEAYMAALLDIILEGQHLGKVVAVGEMGLDYDRCFLSLPFRVTTRLSHLTSVLRSEFMQRMTICPTQCCAVSLSMLRV
jgi:Tat protein secretion system quality control protein TatD with DNase activity